MEENVGHLENLDNVQLRAELLKHGEKVGPVTKSTRKIFLNRLAKKLYGTKHPEPVHNTADMAPGAPVGMDISAKQEEEKSRGGGSEAGELRDGEGNECKEPPPTAYYLVILPDTASTQKDNLSGQRVFTEKSEALAFMKKNSGARLKVFPNLADVKQFCSHNADTTTSFKSKTQDDSLHCVAVPLDTGEKSAFKGPKIQDLVQFRKLVEQGQVEEVKRMVWVNPRYLISSADTPVILHEGMRHNGLHIAAKSNQPMMVTLVLETIEDPEFTKLLYSSSHDTQQSRQRRIQYLVDLYLNSPDKGSGESPLHISCKMGFPAVVEALVMHSTADRAMVNKFGETPENVICSRYKGGDCSGVREKIQELLKGLCLVPLLRSEDNVTVPMVGQPCSPDEKLKRGVHTPAMSHSPRDPRLTLSAYAGPMSPTKAQEFHKQWSNPRFLRQTLDDQELTARRADAEKGYERIGRKLARELHVPWTEYWQFLDAFADFSSPDGLKKLEQYLQKQHALRDILSIMSSSPASSLSCESSEDDCSQEKYFSCDEGSLEDSRHGGKEDSCDIAADQSGFEDEGDVFEDSLEFFDLPGGEAQKYLFGQRLNLTGISKATAKQQKSKESKATTEKTEDTGAQLQNGINSRGHWSYRDSSAVGEEDCKVTETSDTTKSFDANSSTDVDDGKTEQDDCSHERSFNTVMTELSEDLECKLVFSPDGKVVRSHQTVSSPDIGVCIGKSLLVRDHLKLKKGRPAMDVVIKSKQDDSTFLADVLVLLRCSSTDGDDSDISVDDGNEPPVKNVHLNVRVVCKNHDVCQCVQRLTSPTLVTVGLLEKDEMEIPRKKVQCITAWLALAKRQKKIPGKSCFIYGSQPSKTDLDVARAMCDAHVDGSLYPSVRSWLSLVTATQREGGDSWPSPSRLRHQNRLCQLQGQTTPASPYTVSPLVEAGAVTSTPVSRLSFTPIHCNRNVSPERPPQTIPRAWLFKSPT